MTAPDSDSISDKVRFWEEQDRINQELIPRVIRQNELLTKHIAEHDNLPEVAGNAISQALAGAKEEQRQLYEAALDVAKRELAEQSQASLQKALDDFQTALSAAKTELYEPIQTAMTAHKTELNEQAQVSLNQGLATLREESRRMRNLLIGITSGAGVVCIATLVVGILT